ncbi:sortase family protein [Kitasatospora fiedleri]|uniref:hypothetical protein n=1 Tax=Kitasatospora fiedleri TaxID=2991545 RepID=UPI002499D3C3|nr:hypothetical protein [Kitasatospora fiedleri]
MVVEGTTGRDLMRGPGHRRDTVLPGQPGVAVLFGRSTAFGAPFADLGGSRSATDRRHHRPGQLPLHRQHLRRRRPPDPGHRAQPAGAGHRRLRLGPHQHRAGRRPAGRRPRTGRREAARHHRADKALAADKGALSALQLWSLALLLAVVTAVVTARRWRRAAAYLCFAPVVATLLWSVYENAAALLPNVY